MGIKHAVTVSSGQVAKSATQWNADHQTPGGSTAYGLVWKDASEAALTLTNQAATVDWTDLDLTAYTSANARMAYLQLTLTVDTATKDYYLAVRKNGTTPGQFPLVRVNQGNANAADVFMGYVIVGLDSGQICEYRIDVEAGGQCDVQIDVLGYWE